MFESDRNDGQSTVGPVQLGDPVSKQLNSVCSLSYLPHYNYKYFFVQNDFFCTSFCILKKKVKTFYLSINLFI